MPQFARPVCAQPRTSRLKYGRNRLRLNGRHGFIVRRRPRGEWVLSARANQKTSRICANQKVRKRYVAAAAGVGGSYLSAM